MTKSEAHFNKWIVNYPFYSSKLAEQISNDSYGIENMDAKYLAEDLIENEPKLFG